VFRYAFEGVLQAIYGFDRPPLACDPEDAMCKIMASPEKILEELDVAGAKFYMDFIWLCVFFVVIRIACYIVLWWRVKVH
jgi:ATP-binding cassette, subfamily G (WHITE), member 1